MDAAELVKLRTGLLVSWLRIVDECSGAVLRTAVFPLGRWTQVPPTETQAQLRLAFGRWGRPERLRVDNGPPWGTRGDLPTDLELWLLGVEVGVAPNPPRRPQDNGVVERSQGTGKRWGEPWTCDSPGGTATAVGGDGRDPAAGVSEHRRPEPLGGIPGTGSLRADLYAGVGGEPTGVWRGSRRPWPATRCGGEWMRPARSRCTIGVIILARFTRKRMYLSCSTPRPTNGSSRITRAAS